ncbi:MAG: PqqD family protein [Bacteroidales bacterium]
MRLKKNIATSESGFIFNPGNGDSFSVNGIGGEIISLLREEKSASELLGLLLSRYDAEPRQVERDLEDFITQLNNFSLLEK